MQLHAVIHGRVQGVFFRAWTQQTARALQLTGWVRNLPDGSVELKAQGASEGLQELLQLCWQGPPSAKVERIDSEWTESPSSFSDFSIERGI